MITITVAICCVHLLHHLSTCWSRTDPCMQHMERDTDSLWTIPMLTSNKHIHCKALKVNICVFQLAQHLAVGRGVGWGHVKEDVHHPGWHGGRRGRAPEEDQHYCQVSANTTHEWPFTIHPQQQLCLNPHPRTPVYIPQHSNSSHPQFTIKYKVYAITRFRYPELSNNVQTRKL